MSFNRSIQKQRVNMKMENNKRIEYTYNGITYKCVVKW